MASTTTGQRVHGKCRRRDATRHVAVVADPFGPINYADATTDGTLVFGTFGTVPWTYDGTSLTNLTWSSSDHPIGVAGASTGWEVLGYTQFANPAVATLYEYDSSFAITSMETLTSGGNSVPSMISDARRTLVQAALPSGNTQVSQRCH